MHTIVLEENSDKWMVVFHLAGHKWHEIQRGLNFEDAVTLCNKLNGGS